MEEEKKFCESCGAAIPPAHPFCSQCGTKAGETVPGADAPPPASGPVPPSPPYTPPGYGAVPPAAYAYPYYGPPASPAAKTEGLAVASLVISIFSFFICPFIGSVVAIILGYIARDRIEASQGRLEGGSLAHAGIVISFAVLAIHLVFAIVALIALVAVHPWREIIVYGAFLTALL